MIAAAGQRIGWDDVPVPVRAAVEQILGSPVVSAQSQAGGFSPGTADRVRTQDGGRAFVKAAGRSLNEKTVRLHRREIAVSAALSECVPAPTLLGSYDDGEWVALVLEDVEGRHPRTPWDAVELNAVLAAVDALAAAPLAAPQLDYRQAGDVPLESLPVDLASASTTPWAGRASARAVPSGWNAIRVRSPARTSFARSGSRSCGSSMPTPSTGG